MATATRRKSSRQYSTRRWGKPTGQPPKREGPSRSEQALRDILELFADAQKLPEAIAQTVIARQAGTSPMVNWSIGNQLLAVMAGTCDARGFRQWKEVGRNVKKGTKAFYILGPSTRKIREQDAETGEESTRSIVLGFHGLPVFRYEDTEGSPLELPDYDPPAFPPLYEAAERLGVNVRYIPFTDRVRGYYRPSTETIVLCSHDERIFFHELAHAAHERILSTRGETLKGGQHAPQEVVAEVVSATLCKLYDLDGFISHGYEYLKSYSGKGGPGKAALRVLADVQAVLGLILNWEEE